MRSVKRDHKSAKLILQESEKTEFRSKGTFLGFFAKIERITTQENILKV